MVYLAVDVYVDHERFESNRCAMMPETIEKIFAPDNERTKEIHLENLNQKKFSWIQYHLKSIETEDPKDQVRTSVIFDASREGN